MSDTGSAPNGARVDERHLVHGTYDGYQNHSCRCSRCRRAFVDHYSLYMVARAADTPCTFPDCPNGLYAKGYCKAHYERQRIGLPMVPIRPRLFGRGPMPGKRWENARPKAAPPYPLECRHPERCAGLTSCPRDKSCID